MKTYADQCLERAEKATEGPWIKNVWAGPLEGASGVFAAILAHGPVHKFKYCNLAPMHDAEFISHARTDVPELARRLKQACETIRACGGHWAQWSELLKELEAPLKDES